jgi:VCBS repeat-containing protein
VITTDPQNDPPIIRDDNVQTDEDTVVRGDAPGVLMNDEDSDLADTLSVFDFDKLSALGANVTVNVDGSFVYDPRSVQQFQDLPGPGSTIRDQFTYHVKDGQGESRSGIVVITIVGVADFHNAALPDDVNANGTVEPFDALNVINAVNREGAHPLTGISGKPEFFVDTNFDNFLSPQDALHVINALNRALDVQPESESSNPPQYADAQNEMWLLWRPSDGAQASPNSPDIDDLTELHSPAHRQLELPRMAGNQIVVPVQSLERRRRRIMEEIQTWDEALTELFGDLEGEEFTNVMR